MDKRLEVKDAPRQLAAGVTADIPLVSLAWRAVRADHQRRIAEIQRGAMETKVLRDALAQVADLVFRSRRINDSGEAQTAVFLGRLEETIAKAGISLLAPEGEAFTSELMEVMENVAQRVDADTSEPRVGEIIEPAVLYRGEVLRMGKAVIRIPIQPESSESAGQT